MPIFPLPRAVLLPGAALPLHVFEERYRALVAHCLQGAGVMGIATLRVDAEAPLDRAAIWPEIGVGQVVAHQPFPDGRCNIILQSVGQAVLEEELDLSHPFRVVRARPIEPDDRGVGPALSALKVLVLQIGGLSPTAADEARRLAQLDGMDLVDALAHRLLEDPTDQRHYLGAGRLLDRVTQVQDRLASFLPSSAPAGES
ncbi:MAG: LON peptidase substrate-binding domain-containing protein [Myxococcota bacterium]